MPQPALPDVFTADEVARAAGVPRCTVDALVNAGGLSPVRGTPFFAAADAIRVGHQLRAAAAATAPRPTRSVFSFLPDHADFAHQERHVPIIASSAVHAAVVVILLWATAWPTESASATRSAEPTRLVFLVVPGPGGGGGGGGMRQQVPAVRLERRGVQHALSVPAAKPDRVLTTPSDDQPPPTPAPAIAPVPRAPEPLPAKVLVAPVVDTAGDARDRNGVIEDARDDADSPGAGNGGGNGAGTGTGNGQGTGSGIGAGAGGGTGGGPYRPGSGVEPPRLLHEVKAQFTEEARRRNISGDVLLEIVVTRDGDVSDVKVLQGLGGGLDERAIAAVRQWQFAPAHRQGQAVDVVVEVAVEFTLK